MDLKSMEEEYGLTPEQFIDLKALMGDSSDNIPGVGGVGEKTALKLMQEYKSLDNIYANIDKIKGKLNEKLTTDKMQAYMSQTLARIITDIPVEFNIEDFKIQNLTSRNYPTYMMTWNSASLKASCRRNTSRNRGPIVLV